MPFSVSPSPSPRVPTSAPPSRCSCERTQAASDAAGRRDSGAMRRGAGLLVRMRAPVRVCVQTRCAFKRSVFVPVRWAWAAAVLEGSWQVTAMPLCVTV